MIWWICNLISDAEILKQFPARKKIALELLHHRLGSKSTRSLLVGDTVNIWEDVELKIYPEPCCTSFQIYSMNKKARSEITPKPKVPFK